jgi:hypothetical protein
MVLALALACNGQRFRHVELTFERPQGKVDIVAVAPLQVLSAVSPSGDPVRDGTAVGHVIFRGGYVTEESATGQQNVSRESQLDGGATYAEDVRAWVDSLLPGSPSNAAVVPVAPARRDLRGSYPMLGTDNQPLPRFALSPVALDPAPGTDGAVLVPWLIGAWSHNGGWFYGQTWGSASGARVRVWWGVYDAASGAPLGWTDCAAVVLHDALMSPSATEVEDLWLTAGSLWQRRCRPRL